MVTKKQKAAFKRLTIKHWYKKIEEIDVLSLTDEEYDMAYEAIRLELSTEINQFLEEEGLSDLDLIELQD